MQTLEKKFSFSHPHVVRNYLLLVGVPAVVMLLMTILNQLKVPVNLYLGLAPLTMSGLPGVLLCPLVHTNFSHFSVNMSGYLGMSPMLAAYGAKVFVLASLFISVFSGGVTWLLPSPYRHVGCSGLILGYFSFLTSAVVWQRPFNLCSLIGLAVAIGVYGTSVYLTMMSTGWQMFSSGNVSWQLHLFGFIGGILFAFLYFKTFRTTSSGGSTERSTLNLPPPEPPSRPPTGRTTSDPNERGGVHPAQNPFESERPHVPFGNAFNPYGSFDRV